MAVEVEVKDGNPWYLSPDIWTVPGNDPEGTLGIPIIGQPCYVWARVHNNGDTSVTQASVHFYWANPNVGFNRNTAERIGVSSVNLGVDEHNKTAEVLCVTPKVPSFLDEGHRCILVEAFHRFHDPLPVGKVPFDRHVAQRNFVIKK